MRRPSQGSSSSCEALEVIYREGLAGTKKPKLAELYGQRSQKRMAEACEKFGAEAPRACKVAQAATPEARYRDSALHRLQLRDTCIEKGDEEACGAWTDALVDVYGY